MIVRVVPQETRSPASGNQESADYVYGRGLRTARYSRFTVFRRFVYSGDPPTPLEVPARTPFNLSDFLPKPTLDRISSLA